MALHPLLDLLYLTTPALARFRRWYLMVVALMLTSFAIFLDDEVPTRSMACNISVLDLSPLGTFFTCLRYALLSYNANINQLDYYTQVAYSYLACDRNRTLDLFHIYTLYNSHLFFTTPIYYWPDVIHRQPIRPFCYVRRDQ